ncbi:MAG: hypothetical protein HXY37_18775 [Chloroflexi bacterium]|nr:hypothetical protein [Chloroflexota bacterium]
MALIQPLRFLVPTKLVPPRPLEAWVWRERLLARLGCAPSTRLTLVVAPPGFGKSTLVAQWLVYGAAQARSVGQAARHGRDPDREGASSAAPVAWLTLDEHDRDGLRVLAYMAGAIERAWPGALPTTLDLLAAPEPPPLFIAAQALLGDLHALPADLTLVLDDYEAVTGEPVHQLLAYLLRHMPAACRLVLISRSDPPLPLARLRAEQQLTELRAADLRFTEAESVSLLAALEGAPPQAARVAALCRQTEGWALALQLAGLAQLGPPGAEPMPGAVRQQIAEYLADEVLARLPAAIQAALPALAVPERFCAGLAAALLDPQAEPVERLLDRLARANLFVVPLDSEGQWYRFHLLFRDMLLRRLRLTAGSAAIQALQRRAATWLAEAGHIEEAVHLLLAAGDEDQAADLVERHLRPESERDVVSETPRVRLEVLPAGLIARRPGLLLIAARLATFSMDRARLEAALAQLEHLLATPEGASALRPWCSFSADLAVLRGMLASWQGRSAEAVAELHQALEQGPAPALAVQAMLLRGLSYVGNGRYADGVQLINDELAAGRAQLGVPYEVVRAACLCLMHLLAGELKALASDAQRLADLGAAQAAGDLWMGYAYQSLALVAYEQNHLASAITHFERIVSRTYRVSYPSYVNCVIGLALVAAAQGAYSEAEAYAAEAVAFVQQQGSAFLHHQALGCQVRVALARGDLAAALRAAEAIQPDIYLGLRLSLELPQLSQARALIAAGDPLSLARAEHIVGQCLSESARAHHTRLLIAAQATRALLLQAQEQPEAALDMLAQAVALGELRGFVRSFVDLGPPLQALLRALVRRNGSSAYLERLLAACGPPLAVERAPALLPQRPRIPDVLTRREYEILTLLAERWSNQEIAERLVVTVNTVRKHTSTIYDKLGVNSRREAVAAARALGLLPAAHGA